MARHVFLTGEKQIGKSTFLRKILNRYTDNIGGFLTVRTNAFLGDQYSVHIFCIGEKLIPNENNLLFICQKADEHISERFDRLGCEILKKCSGCSLIIMDELGPHEAKAALFHKAVLQLLDGDTPVLGVLQASAESFWPDVTTHPKVRLFQITKQNREQEHIIESMISIITQQ